MPPSKTDEDVDGVVDMCEAWLFLYTHQKVATSEALNSKDNKDAPHHLYQNPDPDSTSE